MRRSSLVVTMLLIASCAAPASPPWLDPHALDDATWGRFCGTKERHWAGADETVYPGVAARTYNWWETEGFDANGVSAWCALERDKKDGSLLELNATVDWFAKGGHTWRDAEPMIDRITAAIAREVKPWYRPTITQLALRPWGTRLLVGRYRVSGGFEWQFDRWRLQVSLEEVAKLPTRERGSR